ncbi:putative penicillin-binding protein [Xylaria sp. FL1042]|nr:putative penicillin-binding protein [Xylaria sp. FL1042]
MAYFLLGPSYPPPTTLLTSSVVGTWNDSLTATLNQVLQSGHSDYKNFEANTSSVSVTILSTEADEDVPLFDFHYSSPFLNHSANGTDHVTKNSIYRIGSISKLITTYMLLVGYGWESWNHAVTRFVPELRAEASSEHKHPIEDVYWDRVTVGTLASHLSGIGRDYAMGDLASQDLPWMEAGLPELPPEDIPHCGGNTSLLPCNRQEYFQGVIRRHPVFAPWTTPVYSNTGFRILGYVLEAMGGTSYSSLLQSKVLGPLGLTDTSATYPPKEGSWVIPAGDENGFHVNYGDETPTAGIYSSSDDLARLGRSILLNKQLSALDTRRWMKPTSHTSSPFLSVGSPWEIWRTRTQITSGRVVDIYTKSGSVGQYNSQLILMPDYGVAMSILVAGSSSGSAITIATEMVLQSLIPVLENITIGEACESLCGTYKTSQPDLNSSITIAADAAGLYLDRWINRGVDIRAVAQAYAAQTGSTPINSFRLQATNLQDWAPANHTAQVNRRVAYRVVFDTAIKASKGPPRIFDPNAHQWSATDSIMYGEIGVDDFVVHLDANGTAVMIEPRVVRDTLRRSESGHCTGTNQLVGRTLYVCKGQ